MPLAASTTSTVTSPAVPEPGAESRTVTVVTPPFSAAALPELEKETEGLPASSEPASPPPLHPARHPRAITAAA